MTHFAPTFFARPTVEVARGLLGATLRHGDVAVRVTEVEAYLGPTDSACHTSKGRTARNAAMWGPPGRAYVYRCYGLHFLLNVVSDVEGTGAAVLVRAGEVLAGHDVVASRRGGRRGSDAADGPGKLAAALALDLSFNHHPLYGDAGLRLVPGPPPAGVLVGPRIGVDYAAPADRDAPLRFAVADSPAVSYRRLLTREASC